MSYVLYTIAMWILILTNIFIFIEYKESISTITIGFLLGMWVAETLRILLENKMKGGSNNG